MPKESNIEIAYVPFKTFLTALDTLKQGVPDPVDRSVFRTQSFSTQAMLLNSLKALGALDEEGHPQQVLHDLIDPSTRKAALKDALLQKYGKVMDLGLAASDKQFDDCFAEYGVSGDTRKKAKSFFLQAAQMAGIPLSPHIPGARPINGEPGSRGPTVRRRRVVQRKKDKPDETDDSGGGSRGSRKAIELRSGGGTVALTVSIDPMELEDEDRDFVFALIAALKRYEKGETPTITVGASKTGAAES